MEEKINIIENHNLEAMKEWLNKGKESNLLTGVKNNEVSLVQHVLYEIDEPQTDYLIIEMLQILIKNGADVNIHTEDEYPILYVIDEERPEIVKILLEAGASINIRDNHGNTPLTSAIINDNLEILELLVKYADKDSIDQIGSVWLKTPLGIAFSKVNLAMIELLLKHGANPYMNDFDNLNKAMIENLPVEINSKLKDEILELVDKYYIQSL